MNTQYRKNLKDVATACKNYTDKRFEDFKWELGANDFSVYNNTTSAYQKTAPSNTLAGKIKKINGNCVKYAPSTASDDTTALLKSIPTNTYTMNVDSVGGMSYKSKNMFYGYNTSSLSRATDFNYSSEQVISFISIGGDSYIGNVISSGNTWSTFLGTTYEVKENTTYAYAFFDSNMDKNYYTRLDSNGVSTGFTQLKNTNGTFTTTTGTKYITFRFGVGSGVANTTYHCKFMLVEGSTVPTEWKQGFNGIRDSAVTNLAISSANLLQISDVAETTTNGITYKVENGVITFSGVASANFNISLTINLSLSSGSYTHCQMQTFPSGLSSNLGISGSAIDGSNQSLNYSRTFSVASDTTSTTMYFVFVSGTNVNGLTLRPMAVRGSTAPTKFKPYLSPITKTIPASIQALAGYGWGINDTCYNYIDFENKKFVQKVGRVDLGSLDWSYASNNRFYSSDLTTKVCLDSAVYNAICSKYNVVSRVNVTYSDKSLSISKTSESNSSFVNVYDTTYNDAATFKTAMSGVYLYYELATPVETDISSYITDFNPITLNNNYASVSFTNTYDYDVPSKLSFYGTIYEVLCTSVVANGTTINLANNDAKYGWSAGTVRNVRDYDTNKGTQNVARVDLSTLNWESAWTNAWYTDDITNGATSISVGNANPNLLSEKYTTAGNEVTTGVVGTMNYWISGNSKRLAICNGSTTEKPSGYLYYKLATPVEENITPISSQLLDVTSGDTITFTNTNNEAVSSEIVFLIEEEKSNE